MARKKIDQLQDLLNLSFLTYKELKFKGSWSWSIFIIVDFFAKVLRIFTCYFVLEGRRAQPTLHVRLICVPSYISMQRTAVCIQGTCNNRPGTSNYRLKVSCDTVHWGTYVSDWRWRCPSTEEYADVWHCMVKGLPSMLLAAGCCAAQCNFLPCKLIFFAVTTTTICSPLCHLGNKFNSALIMCW